MKYITSIFFAFILIFQASCGGQDALNKHIEESGLSEFKLTPELSSYLSLMSGKTNMTVKNVGYDSEPENNDSIVDYFSVELLQDSLDVNHKDMTKEAVLEKIAIDIKPMVEKYHLFEGIMIIWEPKDKSGNIDVGKELTYKQKFSKIPDQAKFKYEFSGDTLVFEDYYFNGSKSYTGKILNKQRVGFWQYWYPNGNKKKEGFFEEDVRIGKWKYWKENGEEDTE